MIGETGIARSILGDAGIDKTSPMLRVVATTPQRSAGVLASNGFAAVGRVGGFSFQEIGIRVGARKLGDRGEGASAGYSAGFFKPGSNGVPAPDGNTIYFKQDVTLSYGLFGEYFRFFGTAENVGVGFFFEQKFIPVVFSTNGNPETRKESLSFFFLGAILKF